MKPLRAAAAASAAAFALTLSACASLGGPYQRPEIAVPGSYSAPAAGAPAGAPVIPDRWWTLFGDPVLDRLEDEALAANQDLAAAAARVEEARALLGYADAERFPQVSLGGSAGRGKISGSSSNLPPGLDIPLTSTRLRATVDVSYDFDFWGRYRRGAEAARAELLATEEGRRNVRLALTSDVATAWFDLLSLDRQLALARDTVGSRRGSVDLQQKRYEGGTISELDLAQAQAELAAIEATAPALERQARLTEDRLNVLLGRVGGALPRNGESSLDRIALPEVPVGLPSELLARRPDVAAAEQSLVAAHARIGQARAAYFPSLSLTGAGGTESRELSDVFANNANIWSLALNLVQPIWNAGRTKRQVEAAEARERQAFANYAKTIQSAFADVEDALASRRTRIAEREALGRQAEALGRASHLAGLRYEAGESSYLEVLDAQRNQFRAQLDLETARSGELSAAVTLFRALGGGWTGEAPTSPEAPAAASTPAP
jgi:multidrug efflux system outer membrane protein